MTGGAPPPGASSAPAAARNRGPILEILRRVLPRAGCVLEIASGTGEHAVHFASALPALRWLTSDPDASSRGSIASWCDQAGLPNVAPPIDLDVRSAHWPLEGRVDAIVCINMIHIAPWSATRALFAGAAKVLADAGPVVLYGPYRVAGAHTAPSNEAFDRSLRDRDPAWGVRDLEEVAREAAAEGFELVETIAMPANNLTVVFRRAGQARAPGPAGMAGPSD